MTSEAEPILRLDEVHKQFGGLQILRGINLRLSPGERRVLIGPNGAGKSTLFHLISGFIRADRGRIHMFGREVTRTPVHGRIGLGMARTFQINSLFPGLSVRDHVRLALLGLSPQKFSWLRAIGRVSGLDDGADGFLERWQLKEWAMRPVRELSYGVQRQLEILLAVAQNPKLLLLDEPTAGLSPAETETVIQLIQGLPSDLTLLAIEHDMDVAFAVADAISVLYLGTVLMTGDAETVHANPQVQEIYLDGVGEASSR